MAAATVLLSAVILVSCFSFLRSISSVKIIDLTYSFDDKSITMRNQRFTLTVMMRGPIETNEHSIPWIESNKLSFPEHTGTHMDAPSHFAENMTRLDKIPIERLRGPGVVIDVREKVKNNRDYRVMAEDLQSWEMKHGRIPDNAFVFLYTGWGAKYPDQKAVRGIEDGSEDSTYHFPSWHEDCVQWLADTRSVSCIGGDVPSIDYGPSKNFEAHQVMARNNILGIENIGYLENLPEAGSMVYASVMKVKDGSGAPVRLFAVIEDSGVVMKTSPLTVTCAFFTLFMIRIT